MHLDKTYRVHDNMLACDEMCCESFSFCIIFFNHSEQAKTAIIRKTAVRNKDICQGMVTTNRAKEEYDDSKLRRTHNREGPSCVIVV